MYGCTSFFFFLMFFFALPASVQMAVREVPADSPRHWRQELSARGGFKGINFGILRLSIKISLAQYVCIRVSRSSRSQLLKKLGCLLHGT